MIIILSHVLAFVLSYNTSPSSLAKIPWRWDLLDTAREQQPVYQSEMATGFRYVHLPLGRLLVLCHLSAWACIAWLAIVWACQYDLLPVAGLQIYRRTFSIFIRPTGLFKVTSFGDFVCCSTRLIFPSVQGLQPWWSGRTAWHVSLAIGCSVVRSL